MTDRRWTSLCWTVLTLALLAALPAAAAPAFTPAAPPAAAPDLEASYNAIFSPPADAAASPFEAGSTIVYCCSATYCCEAMTSSECDGMAFGSIYNCATRCSLC